MSTSNVTIEERKANVELQKTSTATPTALNPDSQPMAARFSRTITRVPIGEIVVGARLRQLDDEKVREIAESMARTGQRHAITVRQVGTQIILVAGRHRLEAAKRLGWQEIDAEFIVGDDIDAQLWEIAENLFRAELTFLEHAEHVAKYVELIRRKDGEGDHPVGGKQPSDKGISKAARELPIRGKSEEARRKEIGTALTVNAIAPEGKAAALAAGLGDNGTALIKIAKEPTAELQVKKANNLAAEKTSKRLVRTAEASDKDLASSIKSGIDGSKPASKPELDQSRPARTAILIEFAKFMLARVVRQGDKIALSLKATEEVREFNRLANRVRLVIGLERSPIEPESNSGSSPEVSLFEPIRDQGTQAKNQTA